MLPVVLPGGPAEGVPLWLAPAIVDAVPGDRVHRGGRGGAAAGAAGQPRRPSRSWARPVPARPVAAGPAAGAGAAGAAHEVLIEAGRPVTGRSASAVWLGGTLLCQRCGAAAGGGRVGGAGLPALRGGRADGGCGAAAGGVLFDETAQRLLAAVVDRLPVRHRGGVLGAAGPLLALPVELMRLHRGGRGVGPLALAAGVSVSPAGWPGEVR